MTQHVLGISLAGSVSDGVLQRQRCGCVNRDKAAPLVRSAAMVSSSAAFLLTRTRSECLQEVTVTIDSSDPDACHEQQPRTTALPMPPAAPVTIATFG
jgi:hypothetical protein